MAAALSMLSACSVRWGMLGLPAAAPAAAGAAATACRRAAWRLQQLRHHLPLAASRGSWHQLASPTSSCLPLGACSCLLATHSARPRLALAAGSCLALADQGALEAVLCLELQLGQADPWREAVLV